MHVGHTIEKIETGIKPLARIAAVFGVIAGLGVAYWFIMDNVYHPNVKVVQVDYNTGIATVSINGNEHLIYAGSKFSAGGHWSVQFGGPTYGIYNRVELVKNDITYSVLNLAPEPPAATPTPTPTV